MAEKEDGNKFSIFGVGLALFYTAKDVVGIISAGQGLTQGPLLLSHDSLDS